MSAVGGAGSVNRSRFDGMTVLVTGATRGLGRSLAHAYAAEGATVVVAGRKLPAARAVVDEITAANRKAVAVQLDVTSERDWQAAVTATEDATGSVQVLVNNAGNLRSGTTESIGLADWSATLDANLTGVLLGIRAFAPSMRRGGGGSILNINSVASFLPGPGMVAYTTSKWALRGLTKSAAAELARDQIAVNALHPGVIDTEMANDPTTGAPLVPVDAFAMPRRAHVDEISRYALFLTSPEASFTTGCELVVDGGQLLGAVPERQVT